MAYATSLVVVFFLKNLEISYAYSPSGEIGNFLYLTSLNVLSASMLSKYSASSELTTSFILVVNLGFVLNS